jgi:ankyrin repeat protein
MFTDNINAKDEYGRTLLMKLVVDEDEDEEKCLNLILLGADVNAIDNDDISVLMYAAYNGNIKLCLLLLSKGANLRFISNDKSTALSIFGVGILNRLVNHHKWTEYIKKSQLQMIIYDNYLQKIKICQYYK